MNKISKIKIWLLVSLDLLIIPFCFLCKLISEHMLQQSGVCIWTLMGIQCVTCGGTRLVNALLNGHILQAFQFNPLIFLTILCLFVSYILLHLWWIKNIAIAGRILKKVYSIRGLLLYCMCIVLFFILRNMNTISYFINTIIKQLIK